MLKTIKVKKKLRLDELIKYVWDNDFSVRGYMGFRSDCDNFEVRVSTHKLDYVWDNTSKFSGVPRRTTFTVEVDKEITKNTPFGWLVAVNSYGSLERYEAATITDVLSDDGADCFATKIYALIGNKLELIWEAE